MIKHRFDIDTDRCICGSEVIFWEDGDETDGLIGEGCEASGSVWGYPQFEGKRLLSHLLHKHQHQDRDSLEDLLAFDELEDEHASLHRDSIRRRTRASHFHFEDVKSSSK